MPRSRAICRYISRRVIGEILLTHSDESSNVHELLSWPRLLSTSCNSKASFHALNARLWIRNKVVLPIDDQKMSCVNEEEY